MYNVVDHEPLRRDELLSLLASSAKRSRLLCPPGFIVPLAGAAARVQARSQRVSAARFQEVTGWHPTVPTRRHG